MRYVYVYTKYRLHKTGTFQFSTSCLCNLTCLHRDNSKLFLKIHILSRSCKTSHNHCKHSITIPISYARLRKLALQCKEARSAGKASGHGREGQKGTMGSRTASFIPGTDFSRAHREEGGKVKIMCQALQRGDGTHTFIVSPSPHTTASQNCKSFQLPLALL